jgi:hypothetical protein
MNGQSKKLNAPILSHVGHKNIILHFCFLVVYLNYFSSFFFTCFISIILYFSNEYWFLTRFPYQMLCAIWQVPLVEQELLTLPNTHEIAPDISGDHVINIQFYLPEHDPPDLLLFFLTKWFFFISGCLPVPWRL